MLPEDRYFNELTEPELWERYCGFLDLSVKEFMDIQKELLMDEIERVAGSTLGQKIMGGKKPKSVEEFRNLVPLTTYDDYEPYLSDQQEDVLVEKPKFWCHSSGRGGYFKWVPYTQQFFEYVCKRALSGFILAVAKKKGEVNIKPGTRFFLMAPPPPYTGGIVYENFAKRFTSTVMPPLETATTMELEDRIQQGFQLALRDGVDIIAAVASVLVRMGEALGGDTRSVKITPSMLHPKIVKRLVGAWWKSRKEKRSILPSDLWPTKGIITGGVDTKIYMDTLAYYWGKGSYEFYVCTEGFTMAMEGWNRKGMLFVPDLVFLEFIPYDEKNDRLDDTEEQPATLLIDELEEGKLYEIVISQFHGMPLLRYRMRELVRVVSLGDKESGVQLPHIAFQRRISDTINIGGMATLDEKILWQALANTEVKLTEWTTCKEYDNEKTYIRLYLELKEKVEEAEIIHKLDTELKRIDTDYQDIEKYLGYQPLRVTFLPEGSFQRYIDEKRKEGADLTSLKPAHVAPPEESMKRLLELSTES